MAQDFWFGADLSYVNEMNDAGVVFRDGGKRKEAYQLFADRGTNLIRLRLWHSPKWTKYSTLADVKRSIRRARKAGMMVLLDFHYSDDWADPGDQIVPAAWKDLEEDQLVNAVYKYTLEVLSELRADNLLPEYVQVGNEINTELLMPQKVSETEPINWQRNARLLNAGIRAAREVGRVANGAPQIMLHVAQPEFTEDWVHDALTAGVVDFDMIGISYYPKWSKLSITELGQTIKRLRYKFSKHVVLVEAAYPWTMESNDKANNILGPDSIADGYPATHMGQKQFLQNLTQAVIANGGMGLVYWEPAWVSSSSSTRWGQGSHWENNAFFDYENTNAHSGFDFMTHQYTWPEKVTLKFKPKTQDDNPKPVFLSADNIESEVVPLKWNSAENCYEFSFEIMPRESRRFQLFATKVKQHQLGKQITLTGRESERSSSKVRLVSIPIEE